MLSILLVGAQNGLCGAYATTPVTGCSAHFGQQPSYTPTAAQLRAFDGLAPRAGRPSPHRPGAPAAAAPAPASAPGATRTPAVRGAAAPAAPIPPAPPVNPVGQVAGALQGLVNYLLH